MKSGSISQYFVDFITLKYDVETSRTIAEEIKDSSSLLSESVVSEHVSTQPFLLTFLLFGFLLTIGFLSSTITLLTCRFYGKCGARRYQSHPTSARSFTIHLTIFLVSWVIMASSSISFIYSGVTYWNSEYYQDSVLISNYSLQDDSTNFYRLYRSKRESSVLAALFNDDDYNGNFEELPASEKPIIFETTLSPKINAPVPIGKDLQMDEINKEKDEKAFKIDDSTTTTPRLNKPMRESVKNRSATSTNQIHLPYTIESKANDMLNIRPIHYEKPRKQITIPLRPKAELEYMQYDASEEEKIEESEEMKTTRRPSTSPYSIPISFLRRTGINRGIAPITPPITTTTLSTTARRITSTTPPNVIDEEYEYSEEEQLKTNKRIATLNNRAITTSKPIPLGLFGRKDDYDEEQTTIQPLNGKIKAELWKEQKKIQTISPLRSKSVEQWLPPILDNRVDIDRSDVIGEKEEIEYEDENGNQEKTEEKTEEETEEETEEKAQEKTEEKPQETTMKNEITRVIFKRVDLPPNTLAQIPGGRPLLAKEVMTISPKTSSYLSPSAPFITTTTTEPRSTTRISSISTFQTRISTSYRTTRKPITNSITSSISTATPLTTTTTTTTTTMTTTTTSTTTSTTTTVKSDPSTPAASYYSSAMEAYQAKSRQPFNLQNNWQQGHSVDLTNWSKESGDGKKRKSDPNFDRKEKTLEESFESLEFQTTEPNLIEQSVIEEQKETESTTRTTRKLFVGSTRDLGKEINQSTRSRMEKIEISTRRDFGDLILETEKRKGLSMTSMPSTTSTSKAVVDTETQTTESSMKLLTSNRPKHEGERKLSKPDRLTHSSESPDLQIVFYSLHSNFIFWFHRFSFFPIAFFMIFTVIPAIAAVISGVVCYANSYHPMDRSTRSHRIGLVTIFLSTSLICSTSLLIFYSCFSLFYAHIHSIVCPIAQLKLNNLPFDTSASNLMTAFEDKCSEFLEPIQILWSSSLFFAISSLIVSMTMFALSKYFLRMKTEHYWQQNDVYGMIRRKAAENIYGEAIYGGFYGRNVDPIYAPPIRPKTRPPPPPPDNIYGFIGVDNIYGSVPQQENIYGTIPAQPPQYAQGRYDQYGEIYGARHLGGRKISQTQQQQMNSNNNNNNNNERLGDYGTYQNNHDKKEYTYF